MKFLFFICAFLTIMPVSGQRLTFVNVNKIYEEDFYRKQGECYLANCYLDKSIERDNDYYAFMCDSQILEVLEIEISDTVFVPFEKWVNHKGLEAFLHDWNHFLSCGLLDERPSEYIPRRIDVSGDSINCCISLIENLEKGYPAKFGLRKGDKVYRNTYQRIACPSDVRSLLLNNIGTKLIELGYLDSIDISPKFKGELREAILEYQKGIGLEGGFIYYELLEDLGVMFPREKKRDKPRKIRRPFGQSIPR